MDLHAIAAWVRGDAGEYAAWIAKVRKAMSQQDKATLEREAEARQANPDISSSDFKGFSCHICGTRFTAAAAKASYMRTMHGIYEYHEAFKYASGSCCYACGTEYHTSSQLVKHLKKSRHCLDKCRRFMPELSEDHIRHIFQEQVAQSKQCRREGVPRCFASRPAQPLLPGPPKPSHKKRA